METASRERGTASATPEPPQPRGLEPGVLLLAPDRAPLFATPAARELLGAPDDAALARCLAVLLAPAAEPLARGEAAEAAVDLPAGGARRLLVAAHPLPPAAGGGTLVLLRDADLLDGAGEEQCLAAHMRAVVEITPAVAHDLRAPINSMLFNLEVLKETISGQLAADPGARERQARYVRVLGEELARLHRGLEVWLAQTAERSGEVESCDLRELCGELAALLTPPARKRQVRVVWEPPAAAATVAARRATLKQALLLVGLAALEAAPQGTALAVALDAGNGRTLAIIESESPPEAGDATFPGSTPAAAPRRRLEVARALLAESGGRVRPKGAAGRPTGFELEWPHREP